MGQTIRQQVSELVKLGRFGVSTSADITLIECQESLLRQIAPPVTDEEARLLVSLFGPDDYFGVAWTLIHLIETAPNWPLLECLSDTTNEWIVRLARRAAKAITEDPNGAQP